MDHNPQEHHARDPHNTPEFSANNRSLDIGAFAEQPDDDVTICRCEEITKGEIRRVIHEGMWTLTDIKRFLRPGMGPCQGQRCQPLVKRILAKELGVDPGTLASLTARPPVRPIAMHVLAGNHHTAGERI